MSASASCASPDASVTRQTHLCDRPLRRLEVALASLSLPPYYISFTGPARPSAGALISLLSTTMVSDDDLPRSSLVTYRRSHRVEDEETVPDSEDSAPPRLSRPLDDDSGDLTKTADSDPPRPPRAVYRSRNRAVTPPPLSYSSMAPAEEVIPDSEDNVKTADTSDDDNDETQNKSLPNTRKSVSLGHSDWRQKLRDIDDQYDTDEHTQPQPEIPSAVPDPKGGSPEDPFGSPLTTEASSQHASHHLHVDDLLSSPSRGVSSSTNTTPQFLFGTPHSPPTPPTSDGKPSPMPKTATMAKGKDKARAPPEAQEAAIDDQLASSSGAIRSRRSEKPKKSKVRFHLVVLNGTS